VTKNAKIQLIFSIYLTFCCFVSGKLKLATSEEESAGLSQRISQLFGDAVETLEQIELESHNQDPKSKEKTKLRISGYKKELNK
jgi:hypothetical protein